MRIWNHGNMVNLLTGSLFAVVIGGSVAKAESTLIAAEDVIGDDGYNKTYNDESKSFKERMKGAKDTSLITVSNEKGGFFLGVNGMFGPVYDAEPKSTSGIGFGAGVEPGYVIQGDSWSRIEFGLQVAFSSFSWKIDKQTVSMAPMTFLPRVGWGNSLGNNLFGMMKLGFGFGTAALETKLADGAGTAKTNTASGLLLSGDYDVIYGVGAVQFTGGLGVIHHRYSWSSATVSGVKIEGGDGKTDLNFINLHGGLRLQF